MYQPFAVLDGWLDPIISDTRTRLPHYLQAKLKKTSPTNDIIETQAVWHESIALGDLHESSWPRATAARS